MFLLLNLIKSNDKISTFIKIVILILKKCVLMRKDVIFLMCIYHKKINKCCAIIIAEVADMLEPNISK